MTTAIVDADIVAYRCAAASEDADLEIACLRADKLMGDIIYLTEADTYRCFLTGSNNFRKKLFPEYKANRKDKPKPKHLQDIRKFLIENWNAIVSEGCEADDLLGMYQDKESICCSIDKDLLQLPGRHFNWVKSEYTTQSEFNGIKQFYLQLLQGDRADNIPGITGIGPKKAEKLLVNCTSESELFNTCLEAYQGDMDTMILNGKLLWIWRTEGDIWDPKQLIGENHLKQKEVVISNSTTQTTEVSTQSTEHIEAEILGM